jgi:nicotinamide-nucleotide amidase
VTEIDELAERVIAKARQSGRTIATGESLTAGWVASALSSVPGASAVLRGGVIAYQLDLKRDVLGVSDEALSKGLVSQEVAIEMAQGAFRRMGADLGVGTTGVAGPDPHDGAAVGSVWIAIAGGEKERSAQFQFTGGRQAIRGSTVREALKLLDEELDRE